MGIESRKRHARIMRKNKEKWLQGHNPLEARMTLGKTGQEEKKEESVVFKLGKK